MLGVEGEGGGGGGGGVRDQVPALLKALAAASMPHNRCHANGPTSQFSQ